MDIKEIAKTMTREEFINQGANGSECPRFYGLKDFSGSSICLGYRPEFCHKCYELASKDVKFKGEEDEVKTYKTWEIHKDAESLEDRNFKCIKPQNDVVKEGDILKLIKFTNCFGLGKQTSSSSHTRVNGLTGFEEWALVQEPKQVDIKEAAKAYTEGKTIYCLIGGNKYIYKDYKGDPYIQMLCTIEAGLSPAEILNGIWFVEG